MNLQSAVCLRTSGVLLLSMVAFIAANGSARSHAAEPAPSPPPASHPKGSPKSSTRIVLPPAVREACDAAASFLKSLPGTSVERLEDAVEDPLSEAKLQGCRVHARGTFAALGDSPPPDMRLKTWYDDHGWKGNSNYDADGQDGTAFGYEKGKVRCFVHADWDGGDGSDPSYVPKDWFEVGVGCVVNGSGVAGKP